MRNGGEGKAPVHPRYGTVLYNGENNPAVGSHMKTNLGTAALKTAKDILRPCSLCSWCSGDVELWLEQVVVAWLQLS